MNYNYKYKNVDYKKEIIKFQKYVTKLKRNNFNKNLNNNLIIKDDILFPINQTALFPDLILLKQEDSNMDKIEKLEQEKMLTFKEVECIGDIDIDILVNGAKSLPPDLFLYHGLRLQKNIEKLEGIFKEKKILSGKYLDNYYHYYDNCNDGEYVSLASYSSSIEFDIFIKENISLLISPFIEAYKTIYVSLELWDFIKKNNIEVKNRYSYSHIEYQVKDYISIEDVIAIAIPYTNIALTKGIDKAEELKQNIIDLMDKYNLKLPIVDIDSCNKIIYVPETEKTKKLAYSKK